MGAITARPAARHLACGGRQGCATAAVGKGSRAAGGARAGGRESTGVRQASMSLGVEFADVPHGIVAPFKVPALGWLQFVLLECCNLVHFFTDTANGEQDILRRWASGCKSINNFSCYGFPVPVVRQSLLTVVLAIGTLVTLAYCACESGVMPHVDSSWLAGCSS